MIQLQLHYKLASLLAFIILVIAILMITNTLNVYVGFILIFVLIAIFIICISIWGKRIDSLPKLMLLGAPCVGKTQLYRYLECKDIDSYKEFKIGLSDELCIVDCPDMDLESDYCKREIRITQFQEFFMKYQNSISALLLLVNFERTDLMKKKAIQVLKHTKKFQPRIYLVITNFYLSENKSEDEKMLRNSFQIFGFQDILFVDKSTNNKKLKDQLIDIQNEKLNFKIDLKDTIFEVYNQKDLEKNVDQFSRQIFQKQQN